MGALTPSPQGTDTISIPGSNSGASHIMGFNPLTPPGYPNVTIPTGTNFHYEPPVPLAQHTPPPQNNIPNLIETPSNTPPMVEMFQRSPTTAPSQRSPPIVELPQQSPVRRSPITSKKRSPSVSSQRSQKEATPRGSKGRTQRPTKVKQTREPSPSSSSDGPEGMITDVSTEDPAGVPDGTAVKFETLPRSVDGKGCEVRIEQSEQTKYTTGTTSIQLPYVESDDECAEFYRPQYNSHGKVRVNKCKNCSFKTAIRAELWVHIRVHMNPNKILQCNYNPKCTFVTEYKHYLEYHIRLHNNEKPFSCELCQYTCINKSMLTSHMKSHSGMYQYHCGDCDYATKYCHSLKIHSRKYFHRPGVVLDEDGVPDPTIFIDVNGRRRGPKKKKSKKSKKGKKAEKIESDEEEFEDDEDQIEELQPEQEPLSQEQPPAQQTLEALQQSNPQLAALLMSQQGSNILSNITFASMLQRSRNMSFFPYLQMLMAQQQQAALAAQLAAAGHPQQESNSTEVREVKDTNGAIDLSQTPKKEDDLKRLVEEVQGNRRDASTPTISIPSTCRRKGRALQLEDLTIDETTSSSSTSDGGSTRARSPSDVSAQEPPFKKHGYQKFRYPEQSPSTSFSVESLVGAGNHVAQQLPPSPAPSNLETIIKTSPHSPPEVIRETKVPDLFPCKYCDIYFSNVVLHSLHMGYHSREDVFKCNMCGEQCGNAVGFSIHLARKPHDAVKLQ